MNNYLLSVIPLCILRASVPKLRYVLYIQIENHLTVLKTVGNQYFLCIYIFTVNLFPAEGLTKKQVISLLFIMHHEIIVIPEFPVPLKVIRMHQTG